MKIYILQKNPNITDIATFIKEIKVEAKLNDDDNKHCEGILQEDECTAAIKTMKLNKSPGSDGITLEFYRTFWTDVKTLLIDSLNEGYNKGTLSTSQRLGILSLMYKKNDPYDLNNWRPLTLLNLDYKIAAHCLAQRIKPLLPKIISTDQNGFIKGRNISYNIRLIQDIIDYAEKFEVTGAILFLDFAKAFDTVEWEYMFSTLTHFGFQDSFMKWVRTLYTNITCKIYNNGWLSAPMHITIGIRQGCPLSALLFVITVETMAARLRQEEAVHGLKFHNTQGREYKISQLADDTTLFLKSKSDITKALNIIETFGSLSGLILNRQKSQGIKLGDKGIIEDDFEQIDWTSPAVKALGIYFGTNTEITKSKNWDQKVEKIEKLIAQWKKRKLTMIGRIQIVKSLLIPQITYLITVASMPKAILKKVEHLIYKFIWNSITEKVKRKTLIKNYKNGGLNMIDLQAHI